VRMRHGRHALERTIEGVEDAIELHPI
jgi:hypothetical protein